MTSNANAEIETPVVRESKIPRETHRFTWKIANFVEVKNSTELVELLSVTFDMGSSIGLPVTFKTYLQMQEGEDEGWLGWYLKPVKAPNGVKEVILKVAFKIGNHTEGNDVEPMKYPVDDSWGWNCVIQREVDVSELPLDAKGALPIDIEVNLYNTEGTNVTIDDVMDKFQLTGRFAQKLSEDMKMLYTDPAALISAETPVVVTVISKDGREIRANSAILAARSPVFRTMFQTPMTELKEGVVQIEDIGGEALEVFLCFVHTAILKESWKLPEVLEELTYTAHKYLMQDLLDFLDEAIGLVCTPKNCVSMIRLVSRLELNKAKEMLLEMHKNQWKEATGVDKMMKLLQE